MRRGPKPKGQVSIIWSPEFAYAIGLFVADGCLSKDGQHIDFTSKDRQQVALFNRCLGIDIKISNKFSGAHRLSFHSQFGDVLFYQFLLDIGMMPAKSNILSNVAIPKEFSLDFFGVHGYISYNKNTTYIQLKYAKREAVKIYKRMYYSEAVSCLERKRLKIMRSLRIIEGTPR